MSSENRAFSDCEAKARLRSVGAAVLLLGLFAGTAWPATPKPETEPRAFSIYPLGNGPGTSYDAQIRGVKLQDAQALWFETDGIQARIDHAQRDPESDPTASTPPDVVNVHVVIAPAANPGSYLFRVVTKQGISNAISMRVTNERTIAEPENLTAQSEHAPRLEAFPVVVNGRIAKKGEVDYYRFAAQPGETLSFEAFSGFSAFDPSITILESSGSWFDPNRLNRIAFNDEPLYFPDFSTDAKLVHRFERGGPYVVSVAAFGGQGSSNDVYQLRISAGAGTPPSLRTLPKPGWQEHTFTRRVSADWLKQIRERGALAQPSDDLETFHAVEDSVKPLPAMKVPGIVEGVISRPGETQRIALHIKDAQDLVLEVETADATVPQFNPVVRVLDSTGREVVTNVYSQLNNCGGYMMKTIQPKTAVSFRAAGDYSLEIHDVTSDIAGMNFAYRVLVRPQIPHIGKVEVEQERINLAPGGAKQISVAIEREENYSGLVALTVEGLPPGVTAVSGSEAEEDKPPLMNGGKVERYFPKKQKSVLLLMAAPDAPVSSIPQMARVVVRPIRDGKIAQVVDTELVPLMVVANPENTASTTQPAGSKP
ncbi:MAG: hypothetical protein JWO48_254 [Bryobacterales bacterium]|nr:hypothetical protein [Bryobacterales bacterium]